MSKQMNLFDIHALTVEYGTASNYNEAYLDGLDHAGKVNPYINNRELAVAFENGACKHPKKCHCGQTFRAGGFEHFLCNVCEGFMCPNCDVICSKCKGHCHGEDLCSDELAGLCLECFFVEDGFEPGVAADLVKEEIKNRSKER